MNVSDVHKLACIGKNTELSNDWKTHEEEMEKALNRMESMLSTRLPEETYRGIINFMKVFRPNTSDSEIEKSLVSYRMRMGFHSWHCNECIL